MALFVVDEVASLDFVISFVVVVAHTLEMVVGIPFVEQVDNLFVVATFLAGMASVELVFVVDILMVVELIVEHFEH